MSRQVKHYLSLPPKERTPAILNALVALTKDIEFFQTLARENSLQAHLACCSYMQVEVFKPGQAIFSVGDVGDKFYVILQGSVSVKVPTNKSLPLELQEVNTLGVGQSFGELALLRDELRNASIISREKTRLAVLGKQDFKRIMGEVTERRLNEVVMFLQRLPMFSAWTRTSVLRLSYYFKQRQFTWKQVVYKQGDDPEFVYFVKEGEFQLTKKVTGEPRRFKKANTKTLEIAILSRGEILGEEDVLNGQLHETTCVCFSSTAETYYISKTDFLVRISQDFMQYLEERIVFKNAWRSKRIDASASPKHIDNSKTQERVLSPTRTFLQGPPKIRPLRISTKRPSLIESQTTRTPIRSPARMTCMESPSKRTFVESPSSWRTFVESPISMKSSPSPINYSKLTLPEVMISKLQQDKPDKAKKKKARFVNMHMQLQRKAQSERVSPLTSEKPSMNVLLVKDLACDHAAKSVRITPKKRLLKYSYSLKARFSKAKQAQLG
jgi:CRP-like cAMP-binding protein